MRSFLPVADIAREYLRKYWDDQEYGTFKEIVFIASRASRPNLSDLKRYFRVMDDYQLVFKWMLDVIARGKEFDASTTETLSGDEATL